MTSSLDLIRNSVQATVFYLAPRLSNVVLFILIGWYYGPEDAGIYTLGVTFLLILNVVTRGMDDLIIRETAQTPEDAGQLLLRFGLLRLGLVALLYGVQVVILWWGLRYSAYASAVILIMALVAFPESLIATAQSLFVGLGDFKTPSWVIGLTNVTKLLLGAVIALNIGSLTLLAWSSVLSYGIGAIYMLRKLSFKLEWRLKPLGSAARNICPEPDDSRFRWRLPSIRFMMNDLRRSLPFMGITGLVGADGQIDVVLLSMFRDSSAVGWYGAATTITSSFAILSQAYRQSVYPVMARFVADARDTKKDAQEGANLANALTQLYASSLRYLAILAFPIAAGTILIAPTLIPTLFGPEFDPTILIVQILSIGIPFAFLTVPNSRLIFASNQQRYSLIFVAITFVVNIALNLALVPWWGGPGAALARTVSMLLLLLCSYIFVQTRLMGTEQPQNFDETPPKREEGAASGGPESRVGAASGMLSPRTRRPVDGDRTNSIWPQIARPLLACGIMVAALWPIRDWGLVVPIAVGVIVYGIALWVTRAIPREDIKMIQKLIGKKYER